MSDNNYFESFEQKNDSNIESTKEKYGPGHSNSGLEHDDLDFIRSTSAAMLEQTPKRSRLLLYLIAFMVLTLLFWANNAPLDEIARGEGKVIPSHEVQIVQNLEGGGLLLKFLFKKETG
ncbi:MAG: hypothetical protein KZQ70_15405 [gamma proteobacterium symbiont of Lucinoma myriamae]|nr:hypothetical protein [gamma proteobacterium symbiont of Lucinoma myriamae]